MNETTKEPFDKQSTDYLDSAKQPKAEKQENLGEDLLGHIGQISEALGELGLKAVAE